MRAAERDLSSLNLDELLSSEVNSVAKKPQRVDEAPAAVFVIDREDIRRSGATNIPDLLRMVPGLDVGALANGGAAVSARGFNGFSSNKLLILVDGREVYLTTFSGVLWDQQLIPMRDIERIEVVRGPGATLWGANAVNGVINIVTRHTVDTLGAAVNASASTTGDRRFDARYGVQLGHVGAFRVYLAGTHRDGIARVGAAEVANPSEGLQGGFRADIEPNDTDALTFQGDAQSGDSRLPAYLQAIVGTPVNTSFTSGNVLGRWTRTWDADTGASLQAYWDRVDRAQNGLEGVITTVDVDFSNHFKAGRNAVIWGLDYRQTGDRVTGPAYLFFTPGHRLVRTFGGYVEDDLALTSRLTVSAGIKLEHNGYSGFQAQPSVRAIWRSPHGWSVWGAVSRATRTPSRFETGLTELTPAFELLPSTLQSEKMTAYEIGWRGKLWSGTALDVTAYRQLYSGLIAETITGSAGPLGPLVAQFGNRASARGAGVEVALDTQLAPNWKIKASGSLASLSIPSQGLITSVSGSALDAQDSPHDQLSIRSEWNVTDDVDFDVWLRRTGSLDGGAIKAYTNLDVRLAWRPTAHIEVALSGFNLLQRERVEFIDSAALNIQAVVQRRGRISLAVRY